MLIRAFRNTTRFTSNKKRVSDFYLWSKAISIIFLLNEEIQLLGCVSPFNDFLICGKSNFITLQFAQLSRNCTKNLFCSYLVIYEHNCYFHFTKLIMYMYKFPVFMYVCYDCESARRDIMNKTMELLLPLCVENI